MNKTLSFRWVEAASAKSGARLLLVQDGKAFGADVLPKADQAALASWLSASSFEGAAASVAWPAGLTTPVLLAGIGSRPDMHPLRWRRAWAAAARSLSTSGLKKLHFAWPAKTGLPPEPSSWMKLAAESLHYGMYSFDAYKKAVGKIGAFVMEWEGPVLAEKPVRDAIRQGETLGRLLNEMRDAANEPANRFGPVELAARAEKWARETGLSCRVWDEAALKKAKCGALLAVAQGSKRPARLIRFAYTPQGRNAPKPVVLVGKAVTFDSGGISLKPGKGMEWMKYDKCGGITALAVVRQAARLKLPRPVVAYVPAVENMPDGGAVRPGDIVTARNGKTVEILNTDAEGRLILADALTFAADEKPAAIVDIATLTGAVLIALGREATAVLGTSDKLLLELMLSGEATGERLWQLPLWTEYDAMMRGRFAELKNMGDGTAGTISGAAFLKSFVPSGIPWAHLDIAGTAYEETPTAYSAVGATLATSRLLVDWIASVPKTL